jgi:NAD(P)-dependent dehydrogenase (short-subunit alcohol dehydrogenase family)
VPDGTAIVIGAGGGIGEATARALAATRDMLLCVDLDLDRAEQTAAAIRATGTRASALQADAESCQFATVVTDAVDQGSQVTAVVHAVAYEEHVPSQHATAASLRRSFAAGPLAAFALFRELLSAGYLPTGSALTAIGSLHATEPFASCLAYNAAHAALAQVVRTLAHEWAAHGIRVNAVVPGWIRTGGEVALYGDQQLDRVTNDLPLGRFGTAEDIAAAVEFLSSDRASYISGAFLTVDGALSASLARLPQGRDT